MNKHCEKYSNKQVHSTNHRVSTLLYTLFSLPRIYFRCCQPRALYSLDIRCIFGKLRLEIGIDQPKVTQSKIGIGYVD